jgi:hypothetical protein
MQRHCLFFKTKRRFSQALGDLRIDHLPSIAGGAAAASDIRFTKRVPLQSGGSWDVPAVAVALFDQNATWHDAADVYGDGWARTWMPQPSVPAWQRMQVRQQLPPPPTFKHRCFNSKMLKRSFYQDRLRTNNRSHSELKAVSYAGCFQRSSHDGDSRQQLQPQLA